VRRLARETAEIAESVTRDINSEFGRHRVGFMWIS
jgi:hypothetical protein